VLLATFRRNFSNPHLARLAAQKFVESHGCDALGILGERAALAAERGHRVAAKTWRDLAAIAAGILETSRASPPDALAAKSAAWRDAITRSSRPIRRG
jgi:hypothetical protein